MSESITVERFDPTPSDELVLEQDELLGIYLDVETNGLDPEKDAIIQLALVPFAFTADGQVKQMGKAKVYLEDPGSSIPPEITKLTGITDEMVARKKLPDGEIAEMVAGAAIVIAHNADFDRKFAENRLPVFRHLRWGCSYTDIAWRAEYGCSKLLCLMFQHASLFYDAHRADMDCYAGVQLLGTTLPKHDGKRALAYVLDAARVSHVRLFAVGSPFGCKDLLKLRGYRWDADAKVWYRDVIAGDDFVAEKEWLANNAMCHSPTWSQFDARRRFSNRIGESVERKSRVA